MKRRFIKQPCIFFRSASISTLVGVLSVVMIESSQAGSPPAPPTSIAAMKNYAVKAIDRSPWIEENKRLYGEALGRERFDVLVVPFQVEDHGIDMIGRSLMTRYLVAHIERSTGIRMPDPTAVELALGERARTVAEHDVYQLAAAMQAKAVVWGYVGHDNNGKLSWRIRVQSETGRAVNASSRGKEQKFGPRPFSNENLPSEVFLEFIPNVLRMLPHQSNHAAARRRIAALDAGKLPPRPFGLIAQGDASPVASAYALQTLAMLIHGKDVRQRETLFERSLTALQVVTPESPDYALLKARAYFYLYRRPAALHTLRNEKTEAAAALRAMLNANLPALAAHTARIKSVRQRFFADIDLIDLRREYQVPVDGLERSVITAAPDAWRALLAMRLSDRDPWRVWPSLPLLLELDESVPLPNLRAQALLDRARVKQRTPDDAELAGHILNHARFASTGREAQGAAVNSWSASTTDYLRAIGAMAESNMLNAVRVPLLLQGLPKQAYELASAYSQSYEGHPKLTSLRGNAAAELMRNAHGAEHATWRARSQRDCTNSYFWNGGQVSDICHLVDMFFPPDDAFLKSRFMSDFPIRPDWHIIAPPVDAKRYRENAFQNAHTHVPFLIDYYSKLSEPEADRVLVELENRLVGHPAREQIFTQAALKREGAAGRAKMFHKQVEGGAVSWEPYFESGRALAKTGDYKAALATFRRYPGFSPDSAVDQVELSNYSYNAGSVLYWAGATEEARALYKLSAGYRTGSRGSIASETRLALLDGDYARAAELSLKRANRYNDSYAYRDYIALLHMFGERDAAWRVFAAQIGTSFSAHVWDAAHVGHLIQAATPAQIKQWLNKPEIRQAGGAPNLLAMRYAFVILSTDREPNQDVAQLIDAMRDKNFRVPDPIGVGFDRTLLPLARGYHLLKAGKTSQSFDALGGPAMIANQTSAEWDHVLWPYIAWTAAQPEQRAGIEKVLTAVAATLDRAEMSTTNPISWKYDYLLAKAAIVARQGRHADAQRLLRQAFGVIPHIEDRPLYPWYQLTELCEWFYQSSKDERYLSMAVEWAGQYQTIAPMYAWAYAFEAKYSKNPEKRLRALAVALFLDPLSARLASVSEKEKSRARDWFNANNPFKSEQRGPKTKDRVVTIPTKQSKPSQEISEAKKIKGDETKRINKLKGTPISQPSSSAQNQSGQSG